MPEAFQCPVALGYLKVTGLSLSISRLVPGRSVFFPGVGLRDRPWLSGCRTRDILSDRGRGGAHLLGLCTLQEARFPW